MNEERTYKQDCTVKQRLISDYGVRLKRVNAHVFLLTKSSILSCQCVVLTSIMMHLFHATRAR